MTKIPSLVDMLKAGMHFGHRVSKWHPKMGTYIFGERNGVHIIDLQQTTKMLEDTLKKVADVAAQGGNVLFVGTKSQAKSIVAEHATRCEMPYISERWIGGLLTNFRVVTRLTKKLRRLKKQQKDGVLEKYTKKEQLDFQKEIERLQNLVGGIEYLERLPQLMFVVDVKDEKTALAEAKKKKIETVGICDTNINPDPIDYIIPANDDSVQSLEMVVALVADAVLEGKKEFAKNKAAQEKASKAKENKVIEKK